ncbi:hypothetical protein VTN77DRAFT_5919 [Rasamsonia byssochlamydoides]|uniref:uncharacterized protein n=1 Tax=Rasamsonia byssochlamydoides TaxID=89139 RepID=UPI00374452E1
MASLNLSTNGPSITKSYQSVINAPAPSGPAAASSTYGQWVLFSVSTPLVSAFQPDAGGKESVLKVQSTGEGELSDLIEEFSEGKIQFAFVKIKDPNTSLPKNVLIGWCGEGVPERTKGYFTSHLAAVSRFLHGYHVQITARSDGDLTPEGILQKVADASGAKYASGDIVSPGNTASKPPVATKPVFTPNRSGGVVSKPPTSARRTAAPRDDKVDEDGWGPDAPPVTRTQLEKVPSAYQPTKVDIHQLTSQKSAESTFKSTESDNNARSDIVKGGYQPVGKVDIAAIRRQAREAGEKVDDRPEPVKGAYEPVGKVDIAAIRARAQQPTKSAGAEDSQRVSEPKTLSERSATFQTSERLTTLPKPKVSNRFAGNSTFTGTKPPLPGDFGAKVSPAVPPVGSASRTFADEGGKTPAQIWAERKAKERGLSGTGDVPTPQPSAPAQSSEREWKSSYTGKTWAPVQTSHTGPSTGSDESQQLAGHGGELSQESESKPPSGVVSSIRDRFASAPSVGTNVSNVEERAPSPPPLNNSSKPNAGRGIPIPGLPTGPVESDEAYEAETKQDVPNPPPQPRSPTPPRESSPIRVAMPVSRNAPEEIVQDAHEEQHSPPQALPIRSLEQAVPDEEKLEELTHDTARATAEATVHDTVPSGSIRALVQYDYEKAEDNEIDLKEGEYVTEIEMVDKDWWLGVNARGERGLFPSNYVEVVEAGNESQQATLDFPGHEQREAEVEVPRPAEESSAAEAAGLNSASRGPTATALYDYEAAEDNEISFPEGAKIINIEFPDEDWWSGEYDGKIGLFPANYVQLDQ